MGRDNVYSPHLKAMTPEQVSERLDSEIKHLATKEDLREIQLQIRELRVEIKEQFQRIKLLIWLPVITGIVQIIMAIARH